MRSCQSHESIRRYGPDAGSPFTRSYGPTTDFSAAWAWAETADWGLLLGPDFRRPALITRLFHSPRRHLRSAVRVVLERMAEPGPLQYAPLAVFLALPILLSAALHRHSHQQKA